MTLRAARFAGRVLDRLLPPAHCEEVDAEHLGTLQVALDTGDARLLDHDEPWGEWRQLLATSDCYYYHVQVREDTS